MIMKVGDKVTFVLFDKKFTGSVVKTYKEGGWQGYINVKVDGDKQKLHLPVNLLSYKTNVTLSPTFIITNLPHDRGTYIVHK